MDRAGGMTLTSWACAIGLAAAALMVAGSHIACEVRGRDECLRKTAEPVIALLAGTGLLFTHSPAEGAMAAARDILSRRRQGAQPEPFSPLSSAIDMVGHLPDPREIYARGPRA